MISRQPSGNNYRSKVMRHYFFILLIFLFTYVDGNSQKLQLENQFVKRTFEISFKTIYTSGYTDLRSGHNYSSDLSNEFSFLLDGVEVTGKSPFLEVGKPIFSDGNDHKKLAVKISGKSGSTLENIDFTLNYILYNNSTVIRKWIEFTNNRNSPIEIQNLYWEDIIMNPQYFSGVDIYGEYGRVWKKPPYSGGKDDPAIYVKGPGGQFILGNESPGMMKQTNIYQETEKIQIGLTNKQDKYAFKRVLKGGETFTSPRSFIILCQENQPEVAFEKELGDYIRKHLGVKLYKRDTPPLFMSNTWNPFRINIDDKMIRGIADALDGTGVEYMIIDDGWQDFNGDWGVHKEKFPDGLMPVSNYIRSKGMKPGCWISLTIVQKESDAFTTYKKFAVKDINGNPTNIHGWSNNFNILTMNIVTPWYDFIKEKIFTLVREQGMRYLKIDLAMVKSAYIMEKEKSGTHDSGDLYADREDFLLKSFERINQLYDEMSSEFPDLVIDCTFEIWGDWHITDYSLVKHADVGWIANFEAPPPEGPMTIRNLAWNRGLVIPTQTMVIGNQLMEAENHELAFLSNFATTPIMLGDPRKLTNEEKSWYKKHHDWFREMDKQYQVTQYYQTHNFSDKPAIHNWDGFGRFNYEKQGGIIVVFRNDSPDESRNFLIPWVEENRRYKIIEAPGNRVIGEIKGVTLLEDGVKILIEKRNTGKAFEIRPTN